MMLILTSEQMRFCAWQMDHSDCETLADCMAVWAMLNDEESKARAIAKAFADALRADLAPHQWQEMMRRNALPEYGEGICASHDFCDANMTMQEAWESVMGRDFLPDDAPPSDADCALWNRAWEIARAAYLIAN
jgi:hypothetical protein